MPWWGWLLLAVSAVVFVPLKLRILKQVLAKRKQEEETEE